MAAQLLGQLVQLVVGRLAHVQRMDAQRISQAMFMRQLANGVEMPGQDGGQHQQGHACRPGAGHHLRPVGVEFGCIQVHMGVYPGHGTDDAGVRPRAGWLRKPQGRATVVVSLVDWALPSLADGSTAGAS